MAVIKALEELPSKRWAPYTLLEGSCGNMLQDVESEVCRLPLSHTFLARLAFRLNPQEAEEYLMLGK